MKREDKNLIIDSLADKLSKNHTFYLADISALNAEDTSNLRRKCFERNIQLVVVKNTLLRKAFEKSGEKYNELYDVLKGTTSVMFTETGNVPAKLIKEFRKTKDKPVLKAAYIEECVYIGDQNLDKLITIKTKDELVGDIILLLQSPMKNVISSLQSGKNILAGVVKTLSDRNQA